MLQGKNLEVKISRKLIIASQGEVVSKAGVKATPMENRDFAT